MLGLYLIASHMAGDFIFQSAHMAANKLTNERVRVAHVSVYSLCFLPIAFFYADGWRHLVLFMWLLWIAHFLTDSKRWRTSNPWPAMPILQDQSLHIIQIAVLGGLFL